MYVELIDLPNWCIVDGLHNGDVCEVMGVHWQPDNSRTVTILHHDLLYQVYPQHYKIIDEYEKSIDINELLDLL